MHSMDIPEEPARAPQPIQNSGSPPAEKRQAAALIPGIAGAASCAGLWALWVFRLQQVLSPDVQAVGPFLLAGASSAAISALLLASSGRKAPAYRIGLAAGAALSVAAGLAAGAFPALAGAAGAVLGSLVLTGLREGWWEDNLPPSQQVQAEVYRMHHLGTILPGHGSLPKRAFDILLSLAALILTLPLFLAISLMIWLDDPGPVLFVKNSVGRGGRNFRQFKFRTMVREAEKATGPVISSETDERVLWPGRFLRKTALDELPQLVNILKGEMSFVGPRPQRTVLVHGYLQSIPGYAGRHAVAPGLAGLAQVVGSYFMSPEEKLVWDLRYIKKASLLYDLRLVGLALLVVFWFRWQKGWDERIPETWLS